MRGLDENDLGESGPTRVARVIMANLSGSPFTLGNLPPAQAPCGAVVVIGWELAAGLWRRHQPDPIFFGDTCAVCAVRMPCPSWSFADSFLLDALPVALLQQFSRSSLRPWDEAIQPLTRFQYYPLPQRQLGTSLADIEESHFSWFTPKINPPK